MSDPSVPADAAPYRAVSLWAVAGLGLALLHAVCIAVAAVLASRARLPLLLSPMTLLLPALAVICSILGWIQIRQSEGTRVGLRLAQTGLVLGVTVGGGYGTYWLTTELALRNQARQFTQQWLEQVGRSAASEADACAAFWNTLDPLRRDSSLDLNNSDTLKQLASDPQALADLRGTLRRRYFWGEPGRKGRLPLFFENELIQRVRQGGDRVQADALGVRDWQYLSGTEGGYLLEQTYRLTTPEGVFEAAIPVLGKDLPERRQWFVQIGDAAIRQSRLSALGSQVRDLRQDSRRFAAEWVRKLAEGKHDEAFLETLPPEERAQRPNAHPGYAAFIAGGLVDARDLMPAQRLKLPEIVKEAKALFDPATADKGASFNVAIPVPATPWRLDATDLRFFQPCELRTAHFRCEGRMIVATNDAALLKQLRAAEQAGPHSPEAPRLGRQTTWRIVAVELETGATTQE